MAFLYLYYPILAMCAVPSCLSISLAILILKYPIYRVCCTFLSFLSPAVLILYYSIFTMFAVPSCLSLAMLY
jgi:hypothetical protein